MTFKPAIYFLAFVLMLVFVGNFEMPHGGTVWENLSQHFRSEFKDEIEKIKGIKIERQLVQEKKAEFYKNLSKRFSGPISYKPLAEAEGGWQPVRAGGQTAHHDLETGMIFGGETGSGLPDWSEDSLAQAKTRCNSLSPEGFWALPTGYEMDLAYDHGILEWVPDFRHRWIVHIISFEGYEGPGLKAWTKARTVSVGCTARTKKTPVHGYIRGN